MNAENILKAIRPCVVESQMTYDDFEKIFGFLERREQYAIVRFIEKELKIFFVDELLTDAAVENSAETTSDETVLRRAEEIRVSNKLLLELVKSGDEQAKQDLFVKNSGLVFKYANAYFKKYPCGLELEDLMQEGYLGMLRAAKKFKFDKQAQFSTYATFWIEQRIWRAITNTGFVVRLPVHIVEKILKATKLDGEFQMQGISPRRRIELVAEKMETSVEKVMELFRLNKVYRNVRSLDMPIDEDGETFLGDFIPNEDERAQSPEEAASFILLKEQLDDVLATLTPREKEILRLRFGLKDGKERTLEEIGQGFGVTRERIRQIEAKALRKLRHPARSKKLKDFLD